MTDTLSREQVENIELHYTGMEGDAVPHGLTVWHVRKLCDMALRSPDLDAANARLVDCLNHAVTELTRAALSEDFDGDDCMNCVERIKDTLKPMGKTSDWHTLSDWYDRLCAACGLDNGDEINILPIAEARLRSTDAVIETTIRECASACKKASFAVPTYGQSKFSEWNRAKTTTGEMCVKAILALDRSKINAATTTDNAGGIEKPTADAGSMERQALESSGAAPDVRELLREARTLIDDYERNYPCGALAPGARKLVKRLDAALLAQPAAAGVSEERITYLANYAARAILGDRYQLSARLEIEQVIRHALKESGRPLGEGAGMVSVPQRWLAFDIGCIECGEDSAVIGTFQTRQEAEAAAEKERAAQKANWNGQHSMEIFDLLAARDEGGEVNELTPIPQEWIKRYVDQLLRLTESLGPTTALGQACMLRADHALDLVKAWREEKP